MRDGRSRTGANPGPRQASATRRDERSRVGVGGTAGGGEHERGAVGGEPVAGTGGHGGGAAPVDLRLGGLAQPQLQPRAEQILERGPQLRPPRGRHGQVQTVGQALRGQREEPGLQVVELRAQGEVAVDDEQQIGGGLVGELPRGAAARGTPPPR